MDLVEQAKKMLDGVTPGPWATEGPDHSIIVRSDADHRVCFMTSDGPSAANGRFIAWAREAVPALAARLDAASREVNSLTAMLAARLAEHESALARLRADQDAMVGAVIEEAANKAEGFSWDLPLFEDAKINEVTDDVACEVQRQAGLAIRALRPDATAALSRMLAEAENRAARIAAGLFPGGYDKNLAAIQSALAVPAKPQKGEAE